MDALQVPSTWRPVVEDPATLQLFLDFYATTKPPLSSMALECLVPPPPPPPPPPGPPGAAGGRPRGRGAGRGPPPPPPPRPRLGLQGDAGQRCGRMRACRRVSLRQRPRPLCGVSRRGWCGACVDVQPVPASGARRSVRPPARTLNLNPTAGPHAA